MTIKSDKVKIGVLSYQGSVIEHIDKLHKVSEVEAVEVKTLAALNSVDGLIIPGGESTTISKLLNYFGLMSPLRERILSGMPVWGTCAGLILLAKDIGGEQPHLAVMDIAVKRNAYGRQLESFETEATLKGISNKPIPMVFIRAPWIESVSNDAEVLTMIDGKIVAAIEGNMLATSFHPELAEDMTLHNYFADKVKEYKSNKTV